MSTVHSVRDIISILSNIIQNEPTLRNVWVQGEVLLDRLPNAFFLTDGEKKLKCFIPGHSAAQFRSLLITGRKVYVKGSIKLFPRFSEYQMHLIDVQPDGTNAVGNDQLFTLRDITGRLEEITADFSESQQIQVQGEITRFTSPPDQPWYLSDASDKVPTQRDQKIHCFFDSNLVNNIVLEDKGSLARIQGAIRIWGDFSTYQIYVEQIKPDDNTAQCQCSECESCQGQTAMCPPLQNPEYELCARCYRESPDREDRVVQAVYAYFDALGGNGFAPQKARQIQMGSDNREADVVLIKNGTETFAAIAECKGAGYEGDGRAQLNSYLSATNTRFGIFANRSDPEQWEFYKEQEQNQYDPITSDQFKDEIKALTNPAIQSTRSRINTLETENERLKRTQRDLKKELGRAKVFLQSVTQIVDQASEEIDE